MPMYQIDCIHQRNRWVLHTDKDTQVITYRLTYRENNDVEILGHFSTQEELDALLIKEFRIIEEESLLSFDDRNDLIAGLKAWARSQWNPNAAKSFTYTYPETLLSEFHRPTSPKADLTIGRWSITEF